MRIGNSTVCAGKSAARRAICQGIVAVNLFFFFVGGSPGKQVAPSQSGTRPTAKRSQGLVEAEALVQQGSVQEAKKKIQEELELTPSSVEGWNLLGIVYTEEKDYPGAAEAFERALKIAPNSAKARNNLGNVYVAEGKLDLAEKEFERVLRVDPGNRDGNYNLGLLLAAKGAPAQAIPHFLRVRPADTATLLNLTRAYLQAGRVAEGVKVARELSAQSKSDVQLHFTLGVLLASGKQFKPAILELETANALKPETYEILYDLGQAYFRSGDYAKAEVALNRALKLKPDSADTMYLMAQMEFEQNRPLDALDSLARAHKLAPENTDVISLLARVSMSQDYFEDAIPLLESGLKLAPQRADLHAALGESYFMSGRMEKAIDEFKALIELDPSARSYAFMGIAYRHLGRFDEAKKFLQEGSKKDRRNAVCLFNLGYIEEQQGNPVAAEGLFQEALRGNPNFSEALLELANLRIASKRFEQAAELLRKYVQVSRHPASGYYKLAIVERSLHQTEAAQRDLNKFQMLSKNGPHPYQHLFEYLDNRSSLPGQKRTELALTQLTEQIQKNPNQPQDLYLLAETYLKLGKTDEARRTIAQLDSLSADDYRTQAGVGVLLARYTLFDDAVRHFQSALRANPDSDDVKSNLADAYFRKGAYVEALDAAHQVSAQERQDDTYLALLADIYAHLGDNVRASEILREAVRRNPDNDQYYLSLALTELRQSDVSGAKKTLKEGLTRLPSSGKIQWGLGVVSVLEGENGQAAERLEHAVELLPEWSGSYSALGVFYYQTGQIAKAREALKRLKGSNASTGLDVSRIEEALAKAPDSSSAPMPMSMAARQQFLQLALSLADRTL